MKINSSQYWYNHFVENLKNEKIDWNKQPNLTKLEKKIIVDSLKAWQLGETSEGKHLLSAAQNYSERIKDLHYTNAIKLFIKEEQKHGNNLGKYLDLIGEPRITKNWGDTLFRNIRYINTSMEIWTLAVISVESSAQIFYQSLKDSTQCPLLNEICKDILYDEAFHIQFQKERMAIIFANKNRLNQLVSKMIYKLFYFSTITLVWFAHKKVFKSGNNSFRIYFNKMTLKYNRVLKPMDYSS